MHARPSLLALLCLVLLALSACDSGGAEDSTPQIEGSWAGAANYNGLGLSINMTLREEDGTVTGTGTLVGQQPVALDIDGTYSYPNASLNLNISGVDDVPGSNLSGTINESGTTLDARLGSASNGLPITLSKE